MCSLSITSSGSIDTGFSKDYKEGSNRYCSGLLMGFRSKPKVSAEELCIYFYESVVFTENHLSLLVRSFKYFAELCPLPDTSESHARTELCALQIELFSLALFHYEMRLSSEEKPSDLRTDGTKNSLAMQVNFTKDYLLYEKLSDVWEAMSAYNETIASSLTEALSTAWFGERKASDTAIKFESESDWQGYIEREKEFKRELLDGFATGAADDDCARRIMNIAVASDDSWDNGIIPQRLTLKLAERLGCASDLRTEAFMRLERTVLGLYKTAKDFVEIKPFRPEYQKQLAHVYGLIRQRLQEIRQEEH